MLIKNILFSILYLSIFIKRGLSTESDGLIVNLPRVPSDQQLDIPLSDPNTNLSHDCCGSRRDSHDSECDEFSIKINRPSFTGNNFTPPCAKSSEDSQVCSCGMPGYFVFNYNTTILFKGLKTDSARSYYLAAFLLFLLSFLSLFLKFLRNKFSKKIKKYFNKSKACIAFLILFTFSIVTYSLDFALMLISMTFNVGFFLAIVSGLAAGYTIFGTFIDSPCQCDKRSELDSCCA